MSQIIRTSTSSRFAEVFCAVVETGSFTRAAAALGMTPAAVSKAVARREAALSLSLFRRTTRSVQPTRPGELYYQECKKALQLLEQAERSLSLHQQEPEGRVRISVPTTYGHSRVLPVVAEFSERYPRVLVELNIANDNVDLVSGRFDLAIRMGQVKGSLLIARKLEDASVGVFATPAYLERYGFPQHPAELEKHVCLGFVRPSTGRPMAWGFRDEQGTPFELEPPRLLLCSGDFLGCVGLARQSAGLVQAYHFIVEADLEQGRLVEVLRPYAGRTAPFSLLQPPGRNRALAVQLFVELLVQRSERATG